MNLIGCLPREPNTEYFLDKTMLTPARILVSYVVAGVLLGGIGLYQPLVDWAGAGATVPLTGFGYNLAKGVREAVSESGWLGVILGGVKSCSAGISAAAFFAFLASIVFPQQDKA